jgi:hypothetical protein
VAVAGLRRLREVGPEALGDKGAEKRRGHLSQLGNADSFEIGLEAVEVVPVATDRLGPKAALSD